METIFKVLLVSFLVVIFFQDIKDRKVTLLFFLLGILLGGIIYYLNSPLEFFILNICINFSLLIFVFLILSLYSKFKLKKKLSVALGFGDVLFFLILAFSFPTPVFLTLFSTSLIFSLVLFLLLKPKLKNKTVPLAGFQALFLSLIIIINSIFNIVDLYAI